jgi:hypothetical protein
MEMVERRDDRTYKIMTFNKKERKKERKKEERKKKKERKNL